MNLQNPTDRLVRAWLALLFGVYATKSASNPEEGALL